ncbi:hypothetical protein EB796_006161 [Bugula neritina]|uniref:Uncharacterized protein n=1 Tax=Bugula neritina TaxID=10212 RepID=A0A7J7KD36_BUGNE|nr:hypothetical protein EB796_006161 [Bugula neritina]
MSYKGSKKGRITGKTIRNQPFSSATKKYGCLVVHSNSENKKPGAISKDAKNFMSCLPANTSGAVEYSLNKHKRWELPQSIKSQVELESDNQDLKITVLEHTLSMTNRGDPSMSNTCTGYYSNQGNVRECVSKNEMNIRSAMQGHRPQDHLTRQERRAVKVSQHEMSEETAENEDLSTFEIHLGYFDQSDHKLYKNMATKNSRRKKMNTPKLREERYIWDADNADLDYGVDLDYDIDLEHDADLQQNKHADDNDANHPAAFSLSDYLTESSTNQLVLLKAVFVQYEV